MRVVGVYAVASRPRVEGDDPSGIWEVADSKGTALTYVQADSAEGAATAAMQDPLAFLSAKAEGGIGVREIGIIEMARLILAASG